MPDIDSADLDALAHALSRLHGEALRQFKARSTYQVATELKGLMTPYPHIGRKQSPVKWASEKQRRWWFATRREEELPPGYKRRTDPWSQRLRAQWTIKRDTPISAVLGNRSTYAPYVQSSQYQTAQHEASGWQTDEQMAEKAMSDGTVKRVVDYHLKRAIESAFRGLR